MGSDSLFLKDPAASPLPLRGPARGGVAPRLARCPCFPRPDVEAGRPVYHVKFHPQLRTLLLRYLQRSCARSGPTSPAPPAAGRQRRGQAEYEAILERVLRSVRAADRRLGLVNLCWLAHSRDVAECLRELEAKSPVGKKLKYSLHPLLSSFYRRMDQGAAHGRAGGPRPLAFLAGARERALVDAIIEDGFAFTELSIAEFDFNAFLASNKRYRLPADLFFEMHGILLQETERRLRENDRGPAVPGGPPPAGPAQGAAPRPRPASCKVMTNAQVLTYLLADVWTTGAKLLAMES